MERSEPALVPEWLRSSGSITGGGNSTHHFSSSSLHSDVSLSLHATRNRSSSGLSNKDGPHSAFLARSFSSNARRNVSGNGSTKHPYSSFTRSHRDKNRDRDKERSVTGDIWDHDCFETLGNLLSGRVEKHVLRQSQSLVSRKPGDLFPRRAVDSRNGGSNNLNTGNGVLSGGSIISSLQKASFDKDFPSLGMEEKQGVPGMGRVSSPGLSMNVQCLPIGNSALIGGEGWISALAEVPAIIGSPSMGQSSPQQNVVTPASGSSSAMTGLNMAEALLQAPSHTRTTVQLPEKSQRLEELAIKQSRQLIPMKPSMPKVSALNSSDKSKPKTSVRTNEMFVATKSQMQQQQQPYLSQLTNQSLRAGQVRSDALKTSHVGKFLVLKNDASCTAKDASNVANNASSRASNSQIAVAPSALTAPKPKMSTIECKAPSLTLNPRSLVEKRCPLSQAQSRSDFFNLMRKKTSVNSSAVLPDSSSTFSSFNVEKSGEVIQEVSSAPVTPRVTQNGSEVMSNGVNNDELRRLSDGDNNSCLNGAFYPDEEEAAFLRSLGWEENAGEDEGLTEEEINAFYQEYVKLRPSLKACRGTQSKLLMPSDLHATNLNGASSELSPSESVSDA